jgi:hypothetical protein
MLALCLLAITVRGDQCSPVTAPGNPATIEDCEWSDKSGPLVRFANAGSLVMDKVEFINCLVTEVPGCLVEIQKAADASEFRDVTFSGIYCSTCGLFLTSTQWSGVLFDSIVVDFAEFESSSFICTRCDDPQDFELIFVNSNVTNCHTGTGIFDCSQQSLTVTGSIFRNCSSEGPAWITMIPICNSQSRPTLRECSFRNEKETTGHPYAIYFKSTIQAAFKLYSTDYYWYSESWSSGIDQFHFEMVSGIWQMDESSFITGGNSIEANVFRINGVSGTELEILRSAFVGLPSQAGSLDFFSVSEWPLVKVYMSFF